MICPIELMISIVAFDFANAEKESSKSPVVGFGYKVVPLLSINSLIAEITFGIFNPAVQPPAFATTKP